MSETVAIEDGLGIDDFRASYEADSRPVLLKGAIESWPAVGRWTPEFFAARYPDQIVTIEGEPRRMADVIEAVVDPPDGRSPYLRGVVLAKTFPDLTGDVVPPAVCARDNWLDTRWFPTDWRHRALLQLVIGGVGSTFPYLHWDICHAHATLYGIYGRKEIRLFAPDQSQYLYPEVMSMGIANRSQIEDIDDPDLERFPRFAEARGMTSVIEPGDALFIPSGWWHTARPLSPSIIVANNSANRSNWADVTHDYLQRFGRRSPRRPVVRGYMAMVAKVMERRRP